MLAVEATTEAKECDARKDATCTRAGVKKILIPAKDSIGVLNNANDRQEKVENYL